MAYVGTLVASLGAGFIMPLNYGVQADNTLYVQYTTGKHAEAAIASLSSFITKVGQGIAGAFPGYVLAACGYINGAAEQPASVHTGIIACVLVVPFVLGIIGGIVSFSDINWRRTMWTEWPERSRRRRTQKA